MRAKVWHTCGHCYRPYLKRLWSYALGKFVCPRCKEPVGTVQARREPKEEEVYAD